MLVPRDASPYTTVLTGARMWRITIQSCMEASDARSHSAMRRRGRHSGGPDPRRAWGNQGVCQSDHPAGEPADPDPPGMAGGYGGLDRRRRAADCRALVWIGECAALDRRDDRRGLRLCRRRQCLVVARPWLRLESARRRRRARGRGVLKRFPAKWTPVRVKKARQIKNPEPPFRFHRNGKGSEALLQPGV